MSRGELATGGWAHLKRADYRRAARLIIEIISRDSSEREKPKAAGRFFEPSEGRAGGWRQRRQDECVTCRPLRSPFSRSSHQPRIPTYVYCSFFPIQNFPAKSRRIPCIYIHLPSFSSQPRTKTQTQPKDCNVLKKPTFFFIDTVVQKHKKRRGHYFG